uniref:RING-CH-type domain-containing protein n=1 Tax=Leptocylindrus danicus TaxID=163516 RepID=A0A7S2JZD2_9STRA|eukprot:CAMPEP_0116034286 /NCGR_PEP_ID=MMETSP0321-20121206/19513_1 /TAXON_ID=163516 /ORGANISM="Leptocylindrus danicus var. danicus, Strain B650" /LENGTH=684 /DNA_ID=CAMNT_0003510561 /DNA_START=545 /DNA_END=2599 /DNA_ORIENTATION=-
MSTVDSALNVGVPCLNPASDVNSRLDTQIEVKVYPCNNSNNGNRKKFTQFVVKPEGVIIQGTSQTRRGEYDLGTEYSKHIGRKLQRYELADTRASQLLVTSHNKSFWVVPAPNEEAFSRHSGTCRLLGDRKHPPTNHTLQVGDFLRVGSVGVVVIEIHNGRSSIALSEEKIQRIMKDTSNQGNSSVFVDMEDTDLDGSDVSETNKGGDGVVEGDLPSNTEMSTTEAPCCYMCFDETETETNPLITPCRCLGDTRYVHVECLRKWHSAESDNPICFLSSVDATCSVCKSTFQSNIKLKNGKVFKLFKSCLEPPYISLLVATKHEMAQRLFNTRFQLSFSTLLKPDLKNGTRPLILGRSSGSDMVLDYRTVSARHATIRFKNGEFIFNDAGSSNGSYLYLRKPVELAANSTQSVQFRLGRSMVSMKVVNKWNRRLLRAVRGRSSSSSTTNQSSSGFNELAIGSDEDFQYTAEEGRNGALIPPPKRTSREAIIKSLPPMGRLDQTSSSHLDLLYALAYPRRVEPQPAMKLGAASPFLPENYKEVEKRLAALAIQGGAATNNSPKNVAEAVTNNEEEKQDLESSFVGAREEEKVDLELVPPFVANDAVVSNSNSTSSLARRDATEETAAEDVAEKQDDDDGVVEEEIKEDEATNAKIEALPAKEEVAAEGDAVAEAVQADIEDASQSA